MPFGDQSILHIRIVAREFLSNCWAVTFEDEHRTIRWFGECAGHHQASIVAGCLGKFQVLRAEWSALFDVLIDSFVEEDVVHGVNVTLQSLPNFTEHDRDHYRSEIMELLRSESNIAVLEAIRMLLSRVEAEEEQVSQMQWRSRT